VTSSLRASGLRAFVGPLHAEFHANYRLVDLPVVVSLANIQA